MFLTSNLLEVVAIALTITACTTASNHSMEAYNVSNDTMDESPKLPTSPSMFSIDWSSMSKGIARRPTFHHGVGFEAETWKNALADPFPSLSPRNPPKVGALIVEKIIPMGQNQPTDIFAMVRKSNEQWVFYVLDREHRIVSINDRTCIHCHKDAPMHGLFGAEP